MRVPVDPKETAADAWDGVADDSAAAAPSPIASVTERATATRPPVQYTDGAYLTPMAGAATATRVSSTTARSTARGRSN